MGETPEGPRTEPEDVEPAADEEPEVVAHSIGPAESEDEYGAEGTGDGYAPWCIGASAAR
jgi:hypothetical protein